MVLCVDVCVLGLGEAERDPAGKSKEVPPGAERSVG